MFSGNGTGAVAVVDTHGSVPLARYAKRVIANDPAALLEELPAALRDTTQNLGVAQLLPRVAVVCGSRLVDLSDARHVEEVLSETAAVVEGAEGRAVAVIWQ